jgi:hypothetical protein
MAFTDSVIRVVYVVHGAISDGTRRYSDDESWLGKGAARLTAQAAGATLWRYELVRAGESSSLAANSHEKLVREIIIEGPEVLIRNDSVSFPPGGCAFLHRHQGPGIRCLIDGGIRIDTEGHSTSYGPGGAWFEAGPEPVFAQAAGDRPSRFIRVMVLPPRLKGASSIAYVNAADKDKPKSQKYKGYIDEVMPL